MAWRWCRLITDHKECLQGHWSLTWGRCELYYNLVSRTRLECCRTFIYMPGQVLDTHHHVQAHIQHSSRHIHTYTHIYTHKHTLTTRAHEQDTQTPTQQQAHGHTIHSPRPPPPQPPPSPPLGSHPPPSHQAITARASLAQEELDNIVGVELLEVGVGLSHAHKHHRLARDVDHGHGRSHLQRVVVSDSGSCALEPSAFRTWWVGMMPRRGRRTRRGRR